MAETQDVVKDVEYYSKLTPAKLQKELAATTIGRYLGDYRTWKFDTQLDLNAALAGLFTLNNMDGSEDLDVSRLIRLLTPALVSVADRESTASDGDDIRDVLKGMELMAHVLEVTPLIMVIMGKSER